jgi:hypothetical protein
VIAPLAMLLAGVYGGRFAVTKELFKAPPTAPIVCASSSGEKRMAAPPTVPVALADSVTAVPEIAMIRAPFGTFAADAYMPTERPAADVTIATGVPVVMLYVVETWLTLDAVPLALSRPTET